MSNALLSIQRPKFILAPLLFSLIYAIGVPGFIFFWLGKQTLPGLAGFEAYGLLYASLCLLGVICNFAILRGQRWGVTGQLGVWGANLVLNLLIQRGVGPYLGLALLLIGFWVFDVYRHRRELR